MSAERDRLAKVIWETSRADEGTISATGAGIVADAVIAAGWTPVGSIASVKWLGASTGRLPGPGLGQRHRDAAEDERLRSLVEEPVRRMANAVARAEDDRLRKLLPACPTCGVQVTALRTGSTYEGAVASPCDHRVRATYWPDENRVELLEAP